jgi:O-methyltransferase
VTDLTLASTAKNMSRKSTVGDAVRSATQTALKLPTRIISYAWGAEYVDTLLTLTLPALLAPDNLPFVASEVPCTLVILTERCFFAKFDSHPVIAEIRKHCPVRLIRLDDLIVSKDKYGMSLTYVLHRGFSDLGPEMTNQWQIFLNADFILAEGSLRTLIETLSRGERIVASPSYCVNANETIPELRKHLDLSKSMLSISRRELARLILRHRHTVIRGKTVNQDEFHMRYMDQFYWAVDDDTLIAFQMPVAIVGLRPERHLAEPNSYWDYGLIREYCPTAEICVLGDSDQFAMLELRNKSVAEEQVVPGPAHPHEIAKLMITWVTPYQWDFLKFPLTLHARDLPANIAEARQNLQNIKGQVMALAPTFPSHLKHPQWEYHSTAFDEGRLEHLRLSTVLSDLRSRAIVAAKQVANLLLRPIGLPILNRILVPALRRRGLQILQTRDLLNMIAQFEADLSERDRRINELTADLSARDSRVSDLTNIATEYQFKLERSYDYQSIMAQDHIRQGLSHLEPEFLTLYESCRQYTMTSWERLYALYKSVRYVVENRIPGDLVECGVWRGGSMKLAAHVLLSLGVTDRALFLYDTFEGMTPPDPAVDTDFSGNNAINDWAEAQRRGVKWAYSPIEEVREAMALVGYPMARINLIRGPVEQTIPGTVPDKIALLRLDTDWYASTRHEMEHLYPLLSPEGVLILDDYGHYQGAARAVDEYLAKLRDKPLLQRIDYSCRGAIKPVAS